MQFSQAKVQSDTMHPRSFLPALMIGAGALSIGVLATVGYLKWDAQQTQLAQMTETLERLTQSQTDNDETAAVTRTAPLDLLSVSETAETQDAAPALAPSSVLAASPSQATTPAQPQAADPIADASLSTVDRLRILTAASAAVEVEPDQILSREPLEVPNSLEALAVIKAGIQDMVAAVVAEDYGIQTNAQGRDASGPIRLAFDSQKTDQTELEGYLSRAAAAGVVAYSASVTNADGSVDGQVLLFDLVERALENGTVEQRRAGQKLRSAAAAALAKASSNVAGEQVYTVQSGDSLAQIALQFYGNTSDAARIFDANRSQLPAPDRIRAGQRLVVPNA